MTRFIVAMTLNCPSNWTEAECRAFVGRILSSSEEKRSLSVVRVSEREAEAAAQGENKIA